MSPLHSDCLLISFSGTFILPQRKTALCFSWPHIRCYFCTLRTAILCKCDSKASVVPKSLVYFIISSIILSLSISVLVTAHLWVNDLCVQDKFSWGLCTVRYFNPILIYKSCFNPIMTVIKIGVLVCWREMSLYLIICLFYYAGFQIWVIKWHLRA